MVGDGPLGDELRASAPAGVRFTGRVPLKQLIAEIQAHDVLCMPSLEEPHGQVMLEGLACARPVVATRVGGPPEVITPECGVLVDPPDVDSIAAGMRAATALPVPCDAAVRAASKYAVATEAARIEAVLASAARISLASGAIPASR